MACGSRTCGSRTWGLLMAGLAMAGPAAAQQVVSTGGQGDVAVTIYSGELALVTDTRTAEAVLDALD